MALTAAQAAEAVGLSKSGLIKAIKTGKISAEKDTFGEWVIQPVELFRVYTPVHSNGHQNGDGANGDEHREVDASPLLTVERLQAENEGLRQRLADKDDQIADLRQRLDVSAGQVIQLTAVVAELTPPKARPNWWQRLLGGA